MGFGGATPPAPPVQQGPSSASLAKTALPGAKADAAAKAGGGISPSFLAGLVDQRSGAAGGGLEILSDIQKSLGQ